MFQNIEGVVNNGQPYGKTKVFIDGSAGTTGLRIDERFANRDDVEILKQWEYLYIWRKVTVKI